MSKVIINSDDFGYSHGVNYGIIDAYQRGILTSTTLMANMPGFEHAIALKKKLPGLGVGVHLTLTCGQSLLKNLTTITDGRNFRPLSFYQTDFEIDQTELFAEWDAQIQKIYRAGIKPTHLDSHHHTHTFGSNQAVVIQLAKKYDLPVRGNFEKANEVKTTTYFEKYFDDVGESDPTKRQINEPLEKYLENLYEQIVQTESMEIMCHPAYLDQTLLAGSSFTLPRIKQVEFLTQSNFAERLRTDKRIELVTYNEL